MLKKTAAGSHYLYAVEFSDDVVKVGRTSNIARRLRQLKAEALTRGASPLHVWHGIGQSWFATRDDERDAINFCRRRWPKAHGYEYFASADFAQVTAFLTVLAERAAA